MRNLFLKTLPALIIFFAISPSTSYAQFEQKLTLHFSIGASMIQSGENQILQEYQSGGYYSPTGWQTYFNEVNLTQDMFGMGMAFNAGIQYNFNRKFSLLGLIVSCIYPFPDTEGHYFYELHTNQFGYPYLSINPLSSVSFYTFGLGVSAKYKFMHDRKIRPYILAGSSISFANIAILYENMEVIEDDKGISPSILTGIGIEFDLSDNITLFVQPGFTKIFVIDADVFYTQFGVNINLFKSKTL